LYQIVLLGDRDTEVKAACLKPLRVDNCSSPVVCVCTVGTEEVDVVFKPQLEDVLASNSVRLSWFGHRISQQRQTCQRHIFLTDVNQTVDVLEN